MKTNDQFTNWAIELQSLAQAGLEYGHDKFDLERYNRIREIATDMMSEKTELPIKKIKTLFSSEDGYQTPKIDTRAAIIKNNQILLVKEKSDNSWSLPGGWCEVNLSAKENCIKEAKEESGRDIKVERLIAIQGRNRHNKPIRAVGICKIFFLCHAIAGSFKQNTETADCKYFSLNALPQLSESRNTREQVKMCFDAYHDPDWQAKFD